MSHVSEISIEIKDLNALEEACKDLGLELARGQKTYKWFGRSVGDYPTPAGVKTSDLGKCDHAIRIPGNKTSYEIGVVRSKVDAKAYNLLWDFWAGGYGMQEKVGKDATKLIDHYGAQVAKKQLKRQGYRINQTIGQQGQVVLEVS